jgi:hypothetical protein
MARRCRPPLLLLWGVAISAFKLGLLDRTWIRRAFAGGFRQRFGDGDCDGGEDGVDKPVAGVVVEDRERERELVPGFGEELAVARG